MMHGPINIRSYIFLFLIVLEFRFGWVGVVSACNTDTTPTQPHRNSSTHRTKNNTTNVAIQQNSRKLLMMDILMSETCWAYKKWTKIVSTIKLVFYSSTITMMHGPINISSYNFCFWLCWSCGVVGFEWYPPATWIPLQPNHTETPTHIEPRTIRPMW